MAIVYFIAPDCGAPIRIGTTKIEMSERLHILQSGSPVAIDVLATLEGGYFTEAYLQEILEDTRYRSEWFRPSVLLLQIISEAKDGRRHSVLPTEPLAQMFCIRDYVDHRENQLKMSRAGLASALDWPKSRIATLESDRWINPGQAGRLCARAAKFGVDITPSHFSRWPFAQDRAA